MRTAAGMLPEAVRRLGGYSMSLPPNPQHERKAGEALYGYIKSIAGKNIKV
jgi:hypothetical protein